MSASIYSYFVHNINSPLGLFLIQIIVIFSVARVFGALSKKMGQPSVSGEIVAGLLLGPSALGLLFPTLFEALFPQSSLGTLRLISHLGIIIFMFLVGLEFNTELLKQKFKTALVISYTGIIFPFILGVLLSLVLYKNFGDGKGQLVFSLFMGISMSITAFPVLARMIKEKNLSQSPLGTLALASAAIDDVTAWSLLAFIVTLAQSGSLYRVFVTLVLLTFFILFFFYVIRPLLKKIFIYNHEENDNRGLTLVLIVMLLSAFFTEAIGIHALFGAFVAGLAMPRGEKFSKIIGERFEYFSSAFLLPLFFAVTGLRTEITLLSDWHLWAICLVVLSVAIIGKMGGCMLAAKFTGLKWRDSFIMGIFMNTRGLVELIVLNIGYEMGVFNQQLFAILIIMALVTTFMTGPLVTRFLKE